MPIQTLARLAQTLVVAIGLLTVAAQAQAPVDVRVALVIGNAAYAGNAALANPANDARAMADTLKQLGFTVVELRDSGKTQMNEAIAKVRDTLQGKQGVGMLYYAGHGLQLDWRNYMVPVDAKLAKAADVAEQAVDVNQVIDAFKAAGNRMNILVLDACRDNPFAGTASGKGLAQVDAPPGTFLAYATAPGNVAEDGDVKAGNGLYTRYLLEELKKPTARIEDVFKRVRLNVRKQSQGRQIPWESTSLEEDFYFDAARKKTTLSRSEIEAEVAVELAAWAKIKASTNPANFIEYLTTFPSGRFAEYAQFRLDELQKPVVTAQRGANQPQALASGEQRFRVGDTWTFHRRSGEKLDQLSTITRTVTAIENGKVIINNGAFVYDQMGNTIKDGFGEKNPGILLYPADLSPTKKWQAVFKNTTPKGVSESISLDFRVSAIETLDTPAGKIVAYRVEGKGAAYGPGYVVSVQQTHWIDPATFLPASLDLINKVGGKVVNRFVDVLASYQRAP